MSLFNVLCQSLYMGIDSAFSWTENIFSVLGLSFLVLFVTMGTISFVVRAFVSPFFR